jgi:hypothetical protein
MRTVRAATLFSLILISAEAQQGTVSFVNSSGTAIRINGTNAHARVALYGSTDTAVSSDTSLAQIGLVTDTFTPGLFAGGTRLIGNPGDLVTLQVRAWTGGFATYELAYFAALANPSIFCGCSQRWVQPVGGGELPTQPITGAGRFQGLSIGSLAPPCPVPEPSSVALAIVGAVCLGYCVCRTRPQNVV